MPAVVTSLLLALGQLADPRILRILLKTLAVTLVLVAAVAVAGWYALDQTLAWASHRPTSASSSEARTEGIRACDCPRGRPSQRFTALPLVPRAFFMPPIREFPCPNRNTTSSPSATPSST